MALPAEQRRETLITAEPRPLYVVWELTLACDLACRHCGSRAGKERPHELSLEQALDVVRQLAEMGSQEVTFIGGEAYLYPAWLDVVRATAAAGIRCTMTTGARALTAEMARSAAEAGMEAMNVSVDGLEATHDRLRAVPGSHRAAMAALGHIRAAGMLPQANTQFNRLNLNEVEPLGESLLAAGATAWQVQVTGPMGRAADRADWLLQPYEMLELVPRIGRFAERVRPKGMRIHAANNLGYYGPWEELLRNGRYWQGCTAGRFVLGIEADGSVKGCPSLPSAPYVGGTLRDRPLREIWDTAALSFTRPRDPEELWGFCKGCYYAQTCQGGCSWTAHTLLGKRGNMPYCLHRAEEMARNGVRERLVQVEAAPGEPFDFGRFELREERIAG